MWLCGPDYLVSRAEVTLGSMDKMHQNQLVYMGNMNGRLELIYSQGQL